jgi:hypothetical protein
VENKAMMLGDLIAQLEDEALAAEALLATGDVVLIARVQAAAETARSPVGAFLQEQIGRFSTCATADEWVAVMNAAGRDELPGAACLRVMLGVALAFEENGHGPVMVPA